jgi:malonate-semialdehyde dehydrogenase (acetylating)/methylmalonate-semialdehyde dehydrogenase
MFAFKRWSKPTWTSWRTALAEHGKVIADSKGDIQRGSGSHRILLRHSACAEGRIYAGRGPRHRRLFDAPAARHRRRHHAVQLPGHDPDVDVGVAIATGNTFIIKPSERDPSVPVRLAELIHGSGPARRHLPGRPRRQGNGRRDPRSSGHRRVSFVGSSDIAHYVYNRGVANGKRVQAMGGAKNHGIVMPDADLDQVVNDLCGAAFGSAGERCMALPVVVPVGNDTADG